MDFGGDDMLDKELQVSLPIFAGPMELLLHLLEKNEIDIYDIPIALVTEQFLAYLDNVQQLKLEVTSEFVVMATHLLEIKSRMLLPIHGQQQEEDGEWSLTEADPRFDLVQRLLAYKLFKDAATDLEQRHHDHAGTFFKETSELSRYQIPVDFTDDAIQLDIQALAKALNAVIQRLPEVDLNRRDYFKKLHRDAHTVEHKMKVLEGQFAQKKQWQFTALVAEATSKLEVVVTFLALLEMLKSGKIRVLQPTTNDDIEILIDEDFDHVQLANETT